ncbi:MAG: SDR family oxidoreductase [Clostridia bacterium]|nr:SDR family oxidoreductase [Clostridia bacterium]
MELVRNKVVMVTGGAGSIGLACAIMLAQNGADSVYLVDIKDIETIVAQKQIEQYCPSLCIMQDVSDEAGVDRVFDIVSQNGHTIDILVCAAGIYTTTNTFETSMEDWDNVMNVNLKGTFLYARRALQTMSAQTGGSIIIFASTAGQAGDIRTGPDYAASKAGILGLTKSLAKLGAPGNVRVNCISPGIVKTPASAAKDVALAADEAPLGRIAAPEDIANAALFLASDMSSCITGETINVNSGILMSS